MDQTERSLREQAEAIINAREEETEAARSPEAIQKLLHELHVHQVELELQTETLRQVQEALGKSQKRVFDLYDLAPVGYLTLNENGVIQEANQAAATLLDVPPNRLINQPLHRYIQPTDQDSYYFLLKDLFQKGHPQECELRLKRPSGAICWVQMVASKIPGNYNPASAYIVINDITARKQAERQRRALMSRLHSASEAERMRVSRTIHDELGQLLTVIKIDLAWLRRHLPPDNPDLQNKLNGLMQLTDTTISSVRHIATELRPGLLDTLGLLPAIEWQGKEFSTHTGIQCRLQLLPMQATLPMELEIAIYRIIQECLTNVARHAAAERVWIQLQQNNDHLLLVIADNGRGITDAEITGVTSLGLLGIRERLYPWNGQLTFQKRVGGGTAVTIEIPWAKGRE